jgi:hypothetical protein
VVTPRPGVDIEELAEAVTRIALVLQLDQPVIADRGEETARGFG